MGLVMLFLGGACRVLAEVQRGVLRGGKMEELEEMILGCLEVRSEVAAGLRSCIVLDIRGMARFWGQQL